MISGQKKRCARIAKKKTPLRSSINRTTRPWTRTTAPIITAAWWDPPSTRQQPFASLVSFFGALLFLGRVNLYRQHFELLYCTPRKFSGPINEIANIIGELQSAFSAAERVFRLLDEEPEVADSPNAEGLTEAEGDVDLSHVNFGYTKDRQIIKDLSLHVPKGALVAIVGPTGAGKTTIINLLMRFYDVDSGEITLDHKPIKDLTRRSLRLNYSMVLQDTWLLTGTVYENHRLRQRKGDARRRGARVQGVRHP